MSYKIDFNYIEGERDPVEVTLYALSTCGFCRKALEFLQKYSIKFKYIHVDDLPVDVKKELRVDLMLKTGRNVNYPLMVINGDKYIFGFREDEWKELLSIN